MTLSPIAISSLLFKLATYIYLRVIPTRLAKFVLPPLFLTYLVCFACADHSIDPPQPRANIEKQANSDHKEGTTPITNGTNKHLPVAGTSESQRLLSVDSFFRVLITHRTPTTTLRLAAFLVNLLLLLFALDFTMRPLFESHSDLVFARVGAVHATQARIVVRYPNMSEAVRILYREQLPDAAWVNGPSIVLEESSDWVGVVDLKRLTPAQTYEYRVANLNSSSLQHHTSTFRTFPDSRVTTGTRFKFIASSCIMPNFPYRPLGGSKIVGLDLLADYLSGQRILSNEETSTALDTPLGTLPAPPVEFALFLGDFVYADVPLDVGDSAEAFTRLYRRNYGSQSFKRVYQHLPVYHMYDDHEIVNNFAGQGLNGSTRYQNAIQPFKNYHAKANYDPIHPEEFYYEFRYGDTAFFVLDTRRHRKLSVGNSDEEPTMLGHKQLRAFHSWIGRVNSTASYKFVISSVPFTTLWKGDSKVDSWAAVPKERDSILQALSSVHDAFVLSGDRHEFAAIEHLGSQGGRVLEVSTSPLSMFWLPLPQSWKMDRASKRMVPRPTTKLDGREWTPEESVLKYIPKGNYKWSVFEVDTTNPSRPQVTIELFVDGSVVWRETFMGQPITFGLSTAIGAHISHLFSGVVQRVSRMPDPISKYLSG